MEPNSPPRSDWLALVLLDPADQPRKFDQSVPVLDRVLRRCRLDESGCWVFTGSLDSGGYSMIRVGSTNLRGHRIIFEAVNGPVGSEVHVDHLCRVKACCNPDHLEGVTMAENLARGHWPNGLPMRGFCAHGHPWTEENIYLRPDGKGRQCRPCIRRRSAELAERRRRVIADAPPSF